jgi:hypothetical protein
VGRSQCEDLKSSLLLGREILIAVRQQDRALDHDEGVIERAVARIAAGA